MIVGVALCLVRAPGVGARLALSGRATCCCGACRASLIAYCMPAAGPSLHAFLTQTPTRFDALTARPSDGAKLVPRRAWRAGPSIRSNIKRSWRHYSGSSDVAIGGGILGDAVAAQCDGGAVCLRRLGGSGQGSACSRRSTHSSSGSVSIHLGWHYAPSTAWSRCGLTILTWHAVGRIPALWPRAGDVKAAQPVWQDDDFRQPATEAA